MSQSPWRDPPSRAVAPGLIVAMLCVISTISYVERVNITAAGPSLKDDLRLNDTQLGSVVSAFLLGYALFQWPAGLLADRLGPRRLLAGAMLCWGGLTILSAWIEDVAAAVGLGNLEALLVVRFLLGIAAAPTFPAAARSLLRWVSGPRRAVANAVVISGVALGSAITPPAVAYLVNGVGWQKALLFTAAPALAMAALWVFFSRDRPSLPPEEQAPIEDHAAKATHATGAGFLRDRNLWLLTLSYALMGYVSYIFVYWFFLYLVQERRFDMLEGSWLATMPWLLTLVTMPLGGILSDWLVRQLGYPWGRRLLPLGALTAAAGLLMLGARAENAYIAVAFFAVCAALIMAVEGAYWASVIEIAREHSGSGGGILNMGGNLGGLLSPTVTPLIAANLGWVVALDVGAAGAIAAGLLWFWISPGDSTRPRASGGDSTP